MNEFNGKLMTTRVARNDLNGVLMMIRDELTNQQTDHRGRVMPKKWRVCRNATCPD